MSTALSPVQKWQGILMDPKTMNQFGLALPKSISKERFSRVCLSAMVNTPMLMDCAPDTILRALVQCAQLGLEPGDQRGLAYLIPFKNNQRGTVDCTLIIGYKGLIQLIRNSGQIRSIQAHAVHKDDEFDFEFGTNQTIKHKPKGPPPTGPRDMSHVYAVVEFKDGAYQMDVMSTDEVEAIRRMGRVNPVWEKHYGEMARKTVIRRISKLLPLSVEAQEAIANDIEEETRLTSQSSNTAQERNRIALESSLEENRRYMAEQEAAARKVALSELELAIGKVLDAGGNPGQILGKTKDEIVADTTPFIEACADILNDWQPQETK